MHVWVVLREERDYQTDETRSLTVVEAVVGDSRPTVGRTARARALELTRATTGEEEFIIMYEAQPAATVTHITMEPR